MASEPPFSGTSVPFGAHQTPFGQHPAEVGAGTASYFGGFGDSQASPTGNPFAFVNNSTPLLPPPGQGFQQQNFPSPPIGLPPKPTPPPSNITAAVPQQDSSAVNVHHRQGSGALNTFSGATFSNQQEYDREDPFESLHQLPRSKSSQAQTSDNTNAIAQIPCSGSSSAPVTGLVGIVYQYPEGQPSSLDKLASLPTSSSSSLIERPPLSPVLPLPSNSLTNATLPGSQFIPYVQSYPHLPTNATNADEDLSPFQVSSISQVNTNAETQYTAEQGGLTLKETPAGPLESGGVTNSLPNTNELSVTEKEYLLQGRDGRHMRGVGLVVEGEQSLASSLNQSMSSLLDSQEDIAHQSPVKLLPPAPEANSQPRPSSPQPSQQFPPPKNPSNLAQDLRQAEETTMQPSQTQTNATANTLPPLHSSSLAVSLPSQTFSVSQPPPLHTSPNLAPFVNHTHSLVPPHHQPNATSELPSRRQDPGEEIPGVVPLPPQVSSHPPGVFFLSPQVSSVPQPQVPATSLMPLPPTQPLSTQPQQRLQPSNVTSQALPASSVPPLQPPSQPPPSQPQSMQQPPLQPSVVSSMLPPPPQAVPNATVRPAAQAGLQPTHISSVLPPPSHIHAPPAVHQSNVPSSTNASVMVQPPPPELQQTTGSLQPPPLDSGRDPADHIHGALNTAPSDVQSVQPPPLFLPPAAYVPLSNAPPSNAALFQSQPSIPSNAHSLYQQQSIPSNAHQPQQGVLSNAHPPQTDPVGGIQPIVHQPTHGGAMNVHSNANVTQSTHPALVSGVQLPPPATTRASSDNIGTTQLQHPQSVPLHQFPATNNLPSTPDSVFSYQPSSEAPLLASSAVTGPPAVAAAHPANPYQTQLTSTYLSAVPPRVHLTQTQAQTQPNIPPVTVNTSQPQNFNRQNFAPLSGNTHVSETPKIAAGVVHTSAAGTVAMPTVSSVPPPSIPSSVAKTEHPQNQAVPSSSLGVSLPPHSTMTAPVAHQRAPVVDPYRQAEGRLHPHGSVSHQHPLPSSSGALPPTSGHQQSHRSTAEHPLHHPHHAYGDGRQWRHTADLRQRERYDPYYGEDPYYEDAYYRDYYGPRPGSRAPHYPDAYEHDPYGSYYTEYDPYTGKYYYVEDPYGPSEYDAYHRDYYGHAREVPPNHGHHLEQGDPHRHTREHAPTHVTHDPGAPYADQSTIDGPGAVFEEGGTFFDSPDTRGSHGPQHRSPYHPEGSSVHHPYPSSSQYGTEPPVQPDWGPSEEPVVSEPQEPPVVVRQTPEKFACPHVRASFAPGGTLVVVLPHNLRAFQRAEVELSHVTELVSDSVYANFVRAVSEFPGPLMPGETPKSLPISYASRQAEQCRAKKQAGEENGDEEAVLKELNDETLLWDFLVLLCQQNGVVVASDISELLTREKATVIPTRTHVGTGDQEDALESVRQLLICGRKRDALELACSRCLWGHALMLASKMDEQSRTYVINRFTASLVTTDPLSTFYTMMLGRTPSSVKPEGLRRAGSWRPHLAMILANRTNKLDNTSIVTLGDSLLESGHLCAAHFCYHLADMPFGAYGSITSKYLLFGTPNSELAMGAFPRPEHLRKMEVFEYAMSLGKLEYVLPHFQVFKLLLALQLTQFGMVAKAFKYCEQVAAFIGKSPEKFSPTLLHVLDELSTQLHHLNHPHGVVETELPSWLLQLQQTSSDIMAGNYTYTSSARSTPSPTFSSVSQAYGQGRRNSFTGQATNQLLKVPGNSYKAGSVESSTVTSSKEGSVVSGGLPPVSQQESYQPSNLLVSQQQGLEAAQLPQEEGQVQAEEVPYSQSNQYLPQQEETMPAVSGTVGTATGAPYYTAQEQTPYGGIYSTGPTTSEGDMVYGPSLAPPASEQPSTFTGGSAEFGAGVQPQPVASYEQQMYGQTSDAQPQQWEQYPAVEGQGQQHGGQHPSQFGYGQPVTDPSQGGLYQPNLQPPNQPSQPEYGASSVWDQHYTGQAPGDTGFDSSRGANNRNTPAVAGDTEREEGEGMEEEKEKKEDTESKKNEQKPKAEQGTSGGILSFFMKPFRKTGPPRAKLPSDKEPRIVWDKEKGKWVDLDAGEEDEQELAPPPTDSSMRQQQPGTGATETSGPTEAPRPPGSSAPAPPSATNAYSRQAIGRRGVRSKYVDVLNPSSSKNVGGASSQAPPPSMVLPPMMSAAGGAPPSFFMPQQPPPSEGGTVTQTTSAEPVTTPQSDSHHHQHPYNVPTETMGVQPPSSGTVESQSTPSSSHQHHLRDEHHHRDPTDHPSTVAPNVPHSLQSNEPQPPPSTQQIKSTLPTQQAMPQFFNPSAFAPVSGMTGPRPDPMDDTQSTVSEMSQEVSRINSRQMLPPSGAPVMGSYNRLRHGRRPAYPPQQLSGPPPRHK